MDINIQADNGTDNGMEGGIELEKVKSFLEIDNEEGDEAQPSQSTAPVISDSADVLVATESKDIKTKTTESTLKSQKSVASVAPQLPNRDSAGYNAVDDNPFVHETKVRIFIYLRQYK